MDENDNIKRKSDMETMLEVGNEMEKCKETAPTIRMARQKNMHAKNKKEGVDDCMRTLPMQPKLFNGVPNVRHSTMLAPRVSASVFCCQSAKPMLAVSSSEDPV